MNVYALDRGRGLSPRRRRIVQVQFPGRHRGRCHAFRSGQPRGRGGSRSLHLGFSPGQGELLICVVEQRQRERSETGTIRSWSLGRAPGVYWPSLTPCEVWCEEGWSPGRHPEALSESAGAPTCNRCTAKTPSPGPSLVPSAMWLLRRASASARSSSWSCVMRR